MTVKVWTSSSLWIWIHASCLMSGKNGISVTREIRFCWYFSPHLCAWLNWWEVTLRVYRVVALLDYFCSSSLLASHYCLYFLWNMEKMYFALIMFPMIFVILPIESTKSTVCKYLIGGFLCNLVISLNTSVQTLFLLQVSHGWCLHFLFSSLPFPLPTSIHIFFFKPHWFQWQHHSTSCIELWIVLIYLLT